MAKSHVNIFILERPAQLFWTLCDVDTRPWEMSPCSVHPQKLWSSRIKRKWRNQDPCVLIGVESQAHLAHLFLRRHTKGRHKLCIKSEWGSRASQKALIPARSVICVPSNLSLHHILGLLSTDNRSWKWETLRTVFFMWAHMCELKSLTRPEWKNTAGAPHNFSVPSPYLSLCTSPPPPCSLIILCQHIPQPHKPPTPLVSFFFFFFFLMETLRGLGKITPLLDSVISPSRFHMLVLMLWDESTPYTLFFPRHFPALL